MGIEPRGWPSFIVRYGGTRRGPLRYDPRRSGCACRRRPSRADTHSALTRLFPLAGAGNPRAREMSLNIAVALVAEASGGIGRAIAFDLLRAGAEVFMLGRSMAGRAQPPPPKNARGKCHFVVADPTDNRAVGCIAAEISLTGRL